jgi:CubicO group peptidase (beta-lactamase class C family)/D-alanyl-D-alanine dipeptidase
MPGKRRRRSDAVWRWLCFALALLGSPRAIRAADAEAIGPQAGYEAVVDRLQRLIRHEIEDKGMPAVSIALVDGQQIVWAAGFGWADRQQQVPASAATVYRVGSVSKLFTDVAVMQLVERGELDLDAPVTNYLPEFQPRNPFASPITLRQLMSHRAGLVRESPVGNYFDPTEPSLVDTVESLNRTELVYTPGARTKYSNAGIAVAGRVLERQVGRPFSDHIQQAVLTPLGTESTSFELTAAIRQRLADAVMWTYDGRTFTAPTFALGTSPAGNLYSSVTDLSRFLMTLFNDGRAPGGPLLRPETLKQMWSPPPGAAGEPRKFGIGFALGQLDGNLRVGHGGAVYGFATELAALPEKKLGAVVIANKDLANAVVRRLADNALRLLLAKQDGKPLPEIDWPEPLPAERAQALAGRYAGDGEIAEVIVRNGRLLMRHGELRTTLKARGDRLEVDDLLASGLQVQREGAEGLLIGGKPYRRIEDEQPAAAPDRWQGLIGEYGWDHNTLYILEDRGRLAALIEWCFYYPLKELGPGEFAFPDYGLYQDEKLVFECDEQGHAMRVNAAEVVFERRAVGAPVGEPFRIQPLRAMEELRREALAAAPPAEKGEFREPDLVELTSLDPTIQLDIRYATRNNFLGEILYSQPRAFMQRPAAEALVRVQQRLKREGFGLLVHDAYRPWHVTKMFWDATPPAQRLFVANPQKGSRHNRGCAVDLTLYDLADGRAVTMPSGYDEFSPRAFPDYPGGASQQRWRRELLRRAMEAEGFSVNEFEWWHFDYRDWQKYPLMNVGFEAVN